MKSYRDLTDQAPEWIGRRGERIAAQYLRGQLYFIWHTNWRSERYEIDLIALHNRTLAFVEVKTRLTTGSEAFTPLESITPEKKKHIITCGHSFIRQNEVHLNRRRVTSYRFDAISILLKPGKFGRLKLVNLLHVLQLFD